MIYTSNRDGAPNLYWKPADGTGQAEALLPKPPDSNGALVANSTTPDGKALLYSIGVPSDLMLLPLEGDGESASPGRWSPSRSLPSAAATSPPMGRWIAYYSDESGAFQVYVRPFPNVDSGRWQVSTDGGSLPTWSHNGHELFYIDARAHLLSVAIQPGASFVFGRAETLLDSLGHGIRCCGTTTSRPMASALPSSSSRGRGARPNSSWCRTGSRS